MLVIPFKGKRAGKCIELLYRLKEPSATLFIHERKIWITTSPTDFEKNSSWPSSSNPGSCY